MTSAVVAVSAAGIGAAHATGQMDLGGLAGGVGTRTAAVVRELGARVLPGRNSTADGQAGVVPMARGQSPGAPSADDDMELGSPAAGEPVDLVRELERFEQILSAAAARGARPDCESLGASYRRIQDAVRAGLLGGAVDRLRLALDDVDQSFAESGCPASD